MLQTFTYWTGWAFTGRSAAWPAVTATKPAAEPRRTLLTIFISTSNFRQLCTVGGFRSPLGAAHPRKVPLAPNPRPRSLLTPWGTLRQRHQATVADHLNAADGKASCICARLAGAPNMYPSSVVAVRDRAETAVIV